MNIEVMLYIYGFVCASMIGFNIATAIILKQKDKKTVKVSESFAFEIMKQISRINRGEEVEERHKKYLLKKLKRIGNMIAFDKILEELLSEYHDLTEKYLSQLGKTIVSLAEKYRKNDRIEAAYFPYIIKKYSLIDNCPTEDVVSVLYDLLREPSIYCRENSMQALYTTGNAECVIKALKVIDSDELFYHDKLISDGLLNFAGDHRELIAVAVEEFDKFTPYMQVALLNFFRFDSGEMCDFVYKILKDEERDDEVRYAAIRYLGRYKCDNAFETLLELAEPKSERKWEYAAIASSALSIYRSERTAKRLKENLHSPNWYIRFNSSASLEKMGYTYLDLIDIMDGNDRYATEILRYRFDIKKMQEEEAAKV